MPTVPTPLAAPEVVSLARIEVILAAAQASQVSVPTTAKTTGLLWPRGK